MEDTPWGAEQVVLTTSLSVAGSVQTLGIRTVEIDTDEMTTRHRHRHKHEILVVEQGLVELETGGDYVELAAGDTHVIEAGTPHQLQNIDDQVARLTEIGLPFDPDDSQVIDDPYGSGR